MHTSCYQTSTEGRPIDKGGTYSVGSGQVKVLKNGAVQVMYQSINEYLLDEELL